jgi:hypothetical protein
MVKTTDMRNSHDIAPLWWFNCSTYRTLLIERQVGSHLMIVGTVRFKLPPQMPFTYDDNVIEALSPYGPDNSLDIRILPRGARGRKYFVDAETFYTIAESVTIDAVPVAQ